MRPRAQLTLVVFMRHGQAANNVERVLAGRSPGVPLTEEGRRQAAAAAELLSDMRISRVLASPIERAAQTAEIVAGRIGAQAETDDRLVELDMGKYTGMRYDDILSKHGNVFQKFYSGDLELAHNGVETFEMVKKRVMGLVDEIGRAADGAEAAADGAEAAAPGGLPGSDPAGAAAAADADGAAGGNVLLVTHMDPIKAVLSASAGLDSDLLLNLVVANASLTVFVRHGGRLWLRALNVLEPQRYAERW